MSTVLGYNRRIVTILHQLAGPSGRRLALHVKPSAERAIRQGHPWIFDQSIRRQSHAGSPGDLAVIFDKKDRFLAIGLYDPHSPIRVRILQHGTPATINQAWFDERLADSAGRRNTLAKTRTTAYRLVHGENDGLPGLIIDKYEHNYVVKLYSHSWIPHLDKVVSALSSAVHVERIVLRLSNSLIEANDEHDGLFDGQVLVGPGLDEPVGFIENGLHFEADILQGQKTGFFLDQRDNRSRVEEMIKQDKTLLKVLNVFAYTGAFSLYSARAGAQRVESLDASKPALEAARRNFWLNREHRSIAAIEHETVAGDAFDLLDRFVQEGRGYDVVIIDPPAFARRRDEVVRALNGYSVLTRAGVQLLRPGGRFVMSSCSSQVSAEAFYATVRQASSEAGRPLNEIVRTGHPIDHPVSFPQGEYLKCLFAIVP